jgi:hypothetical protein
MIGTLIPLTPVSRLNSYPAMRNVRELGHWTLRLDFASTAATKDRRLEFRYRFTSAQTQLASEAKEALLHDLRVTSGRGHSEDFTPPLLTPSDGVFLWARRFGSTATRFAGSRNLELPVASVVQRLFPNRSLSMQRRTAVPAPARATKAAVAPLRAGYGLVVDGQLKAEFETRDPALKAAKDLKTRFPMLQIKVFSAEQNRTEEIVPAVA